MTDHSFPFFIRGQRVGMVTEVTQHAGFFRGRLSLDDCPEFQLFSAVVELAREVDTVDSHDYLEKWNLWFQMCGELQDLHLWIGEAQTQVEEFTLESDWSVEWRNMDAEFVGL